MEVDGMYYEKYGNGDIPILAWHGFGQTLQEYYSWIPWIDENYTLYLFDVYYHGKSCRVESPLTHAQWKAIMQHFFERENIDNFHCVGYSLGGRFALATAMLFPNRCLSVQLLAPDGIRYNPWYLLATQPFFIPILGYLLHHPTLVTKTAQYFSSWGLLSKPMYKFVMSQLHLQPLRALIFRCWVYFKTITFPLPQLIERFNQYQIPTVLVLGKYDRIVPMHYFTLWNTKKNHNTIKWVQCGHGKIIAEAIHVMEFKKKD